MCKGTILDKMRATLSRVLTLPKEDESDEDLYDICRAYGLLLNIYNKSQSDNHCISHSKEVRIEFSSFLECGVDMKNVSAM